MKIIKKSRKSGIFYFVIPEEAIANIPNLFNKYEIADNFRSSNFRNDVIVQYLPDNGLNHA
ncbi:MAG: hypothetical protein KDD29_08290, partial [Flavobacteriales bacterium]|nr:hypothetical protein [Flavobacteriales bacterium]